MPRTAAMLIIGTEILTGKIQETNVQDLARELFSLGIVLERVVVCRDNIETIAADLVDLASRFDLVFTTGGVGPTHDDVTYKAVARAFDRPIVRSRELADLIREFVGERVQEGHLRMADIPEGAELLRSDDVRWPTIYLRNVFVLPGLPKAFRLKLPALREYLRGVEQPFISECVYTVCDEGELAEALDRLAADHPEVEIGSYPVTDQPRYRVKLTVDGRNPETVALAVAALRRMLPADKLVDLHE